jgi:hypothetical protein
VDSISRDKVERRFQVVGGALRRALRSGDFIDDKAIAIEGVVLAIGRHRLLFGHAHRKWLRDQGCGSHLRGGADWALLVPSQKLAISHLGKPPQLREATELQLTRLEGAQLYRVGRRL